MIRISETIEKLSLKRPIFHSEADFQHAFAWEIQSQFSDASIRLEYPILINDTQIYLDLWLTIEQQNIAIELKYKTRALQATIRGERFALKNQSAQDVGRYDFIKDIERIEQVISTRKNVIGYAILLTNDSAYWKQPRNNRTVDSDFRLQQRRIIKGTLAWKPEASAGTKKNREEPIVLNRSYSSAWENYSKPSYNSYGAFRYLMMDISEPKTTGAG